MPISKDYGEQDLGASLQLFARSVVEGFITGLHKSPFHGYSAEFSEHRLFNTGDSLKAVDWKLFARTDKLFVKRFEEETNLRCQIIIDASGSMGFPANAPSKLDFSRKGAAVLIELLTRQKDAVGLSILGSKENTETEVGTTGVHKKHLLDLLASLDPGGLHEQANLAANLHILAEKLHRRSMVIIFSDLLENVEEPASLLAAFRHLRHARHEVIVFHVQHAGLEALLDYPDRPTRFIDLETGLQTVLNPLEIRASYQQAFRNFNIHLKDHCALNGLDYFICDSEAGYAAIMRAWLIKRQKKA